MTGKTRIMTGQVRHAVRYVQSGTQRPASAGQVAQRLGISRTTAKKYLEIAADFGMVTAVETVHINGFPARLFYVQEKL